MSEVKQMLRGLLALPGGVSRETWVEIGTQALTEIERLERSKRQLAKGCKRLKEDLRTAEVVAADQRGKAHDLTVEVERLKRSETRLGQALSEEMGTTHELREENERLKNALLPGLYPAKMLAGIDLGSPDGDRNSRPGRSMRDMESGLLELRRHSRFMFLGRAADCE